MKRFSLLHATRNTPERALATRAKWLTAAKHPDRIEHIFGVQDDDGSAWLLGSDSMISTSLPPPEWASSSVANWNAAAAISTGQWLIVIADDLEPIKHWDAALIHDILEIGPDSETKPTAIQAPDGISNDSLLRHPIINRALYQKRGYVFNPEFYGVFCDNDLTLWCYKNADTYAARHFCVTHRHPINGTRENDSICSLQNSDAAYRYGAQKMAQLWPQTVARHIVETHSVWIGPRLSLMERLTLTLLLRYGHKPTLWVGRELDRSTVPPGVEIREIPYEAIDPIGFGGISHPGLPNGGIGSLAHWSDYFGAMTLHEHGGLWVQLDIAALAPIYASEHCFTTWAGGLSPCVWSAPKGSKFADTWSNYVADGSESAWAGEDWHDCMHAIRAILCDTATIYGTIQEPEYFDCGCLYDSPYNQPLHDPRIKLIHWSNATHGQSKDDPTPGSFYEQLCKRERLI